MKRILIYSWLLFFAFSCNKSTNPDPNPPDPPDPPLHAGFIKGADVSWVTEMEAAGRKFYNSTGTEKECMQLLKDIGMNAIRLRVWVNPTDSWCNTADVVAKAVRAKNLGLKIMIDFHYSDWWADPGKQNKPAAWVGQDLNTLKQSVANHTTAVLNALKTSGVTPAWVQVGNETNDGMLWPDGKASTNMNKFAQLFIAGYNAVKAVDASIKVIVHISNGWDNNLFRWLLDGLKNNGAQWDITGMSLYPSSANWPTLNGQCLTNMNDMVSRYNTDVMVLEVGMSWDQAAASNSFLADLITKVNSVAGNRGLGVLYWEPEAYNNWKGYTLGAFDNNGKPTAALNAFN
ncbi:MAG TPA: glycosyl hydrolase 53 family protein [Chitinophagaceae bacterium]|nr:glycosyl hydrolase 53 family protein [Chitinophagaceae bacterium]